MTHGLIHQILFSKQEKEKRNEQLRKEMEAAWEYSERVRRYQVAKEAIVSLTKRLSDYQLMRTELERQRDRVIKQYAKEVELFAMMGVENTQAIITNQNKKTEKITAQINNYIRLEQTIKTSIDHNQRILDTSPK